MFLHLLNDTQQKSFLVLAKQFIEVDRKFADEEQNLLELMYAEMGRGFDTRQARASVLLELIGVGHADQEFSPEESALLGKIAGAFGVSQEEVAAMDDWVQRQIALAREVDKFWSG